MVTRRRWIKPYRRRTALRIATFNANNLFARWSFATELPRTVSDAALATLHADAAVGEVASVEQPLTKPAVVNVTLDGRRDDDRGAAYVPRKAGARPPARRSRTTRRGRRPIRPRVVLD